MVGEGIPFNNYSFVHGVGARQVYIGLHRVYAGRVAWELICGPPDVHSVAERCFFLCMVS